jgi:hypothetical protein
VIFFFLVFLFVVSTAGALAVALTVAVSYFIDRVSRIKAKAITKDGTTARAPRGLYRTETDGRFLGTHEVRS